MEKRLIPNIYGDIKKRKLSVSVPGSKSITNRAFLLAALSDGECELEGILMSDDSRYFVSALKTLGFDIETDEVNHRARVCGLGGRIPKKEAEIYVGSAGTAARFLAALLGLSEGRYTITSSDQMKKRPMKALTDSLTDMGCRIDFIEEEGHFPFTVEAGKTDVAEIEIDIDISSQFLSALLIAAPILGRDIDIRVKGSHGLAYVEMTVKMMEAFGVKVEHSGNVYSVKANSTYHAMKYNIEPDASAAAYFYAMSPVLGLEVTVPGITLNSLQGDIQFTGVLEKMGCERSTDKEGNIVLMPPKAELKGGRFDLHSFSDQAITLAAVSVFATEKVEITGISHIRAQECDRISGIVENLKRLGIETENDDDSITVFPGKPVGTEIETYDDHRMSMGFSLVGLRTDGVEILNPYCCRKTFENYYEVLDSVIEEITK